MARRRLTNDTDLHEDVLPLRQAAQISPAMEY
jgi:hypothetical protein